VAVGAGVGVGVGVGVGAEVGADAIVGCVSICADALEVRVSLVPPRNPARSGVSSWKWPLTVTVAMLPIAAVQAGEQAIDTSEVETEKKEAFGSVTTRHMILFVFLSQAALEMKEVGLSAACIAPSRAALPTVDLRGEERTPAERA